MTKDLNTLMSQLLNTFVLIDDEFKKHADKILFDYTITELHCLEHIGKIDKPNVTKLSQSLHLTRGGVSKLIKKLINKKVVCSYQLDTNKKEIYYQLTALGRDIFDAHEQIHQKWSAKDLEFLQQFDANQVTFVMTFIQKYSQYLVETLKTFNWSK